MNKLLVFDGNSIINRAFYAVRDLTNRDGLHTGALFGFVNILKKHIDTQKPDYCAVAFDVHAPTFRHKQYDLYKGTRKPMPEELRQQMPYAHRLVQAMGLTVLEEEGFEADDFLGAASALAEENGLTCALVTGDRDALQLVSDQTTVLLCTTGKDVPMTPEAILEKYGLTPPQLIDVKALMGDASDNIPGVRGIGEKGALSLIQKAGSLDNLYASLDALGLTAGLRTKLEEGQESATLSYELATILRKIPSLTSLEQLAVQEPDQAALLDLFTELEFTKLAAAFGLFAASNAPEKTAPPRKKVASDPPVAPAEGQMQLTLSFAPANESVAPTLDKLSLSQLECEETCYALPEDGVLYVKQGAICGIVNEDELDTFLRSFAPVVFDAKEYYHFCFARALSADEVAVRESLELMSYLLDPSGGASTLARSSGIFLSRLMSPSASAAERLSVMEALYRVLSARIRDEGMEELYRTIELPLSKILCEMEQTGILIDRNALIVYGEKLKLRLEELAARIYEAAGSSFNLNSPKQLGVVLFEKLGLPHAKKTKTGYSTDAETLENLRHLSPVVEDILTWRKLQKLHGTYIESLKKQTETDARVHTTFLQTMTVTGRLSSQDPNLQNIPVRTEEGRQIRRFFIAKEGCVLLDADYSQVELRILAHLSGDEAFLRAFREGEDIHRRTAAEIFHVSPDEVTDAMRKDAKAINFGIVYGIGDYSLSQDLSISVKQAGEYIRHYFASYPDVKAYLDRTVQEAKQTGEVTTLYGRRRRIPELSSPKKTLVAFGERVAMNTPIQGTAADIMKLAMVRVHERLKQEGFTAKILLQVHDELLLECPLKEKEAVSALLKEEMEHSAELSLTLVAEVGEGQNWLDAK